MTGLLDLSPPGTPEDIGMGRVLFDPIRDPYLRDYRSEIAISSLLPTTFTVGNSCIELVAYHFYGRQVSTRRAGLFITRVRSPELLPASRPYIYSWQGLY